MKCSGVVLLAVVPSLIVLQGCFEAPRVEDPGRRIANFSHAGFERQSCLQCHEKDRPSATTVPITMDGDVIGDGKPVKPQSPVIHGEGKDCLQCHRAGGNWSDVTAFDHRPVPNDCARCHEASRPAPIQGVAHGGGQDCVGCHRAGTLWNDLLAFNHKPSPADCRICHEVNRPMQTRLPPPVSSAAEGHFGAQDCGACHETGAGVARTFVFTHQSSAAKTVSTCLPCHEPARKSPSHYPGQDCVGCHLDPAKPWILSVKSPHPSNVPMPPSCNGCHETVRPVTTRIGSAGPALSHHFSSQDCIACHEPKSSVLGVFRFKHDANGVSRSTCSECHETSRPRADHYPEKDCGSCHTNPANPWNLPTASPHPGNSPMPPHCNACHEGDRPSTTLFPNASKRTQGHFTGQDCFLCHNPRNGGTVTVFRFAHEPGGRKQVSCLPCHETSRPAPAHFVGNDCVSCHMDPTKAWAETVPSPHPANSPALAQCLSCHEKDRPLKTLFPATSTALNGHFGTSECLNCHEPRTAENGVFIFDHQANGIVRTTCLPCHEQQKPVGEVNKFNHNPYGSGDCVSCHKQPGTTWAGGIYTHAPVPTSCNACHESTRPTGHYAAKDCSSCHVSASATVSRFTFGHTDSANRNISFCLPCHTSDGQKEHRNDSKVSLTGDGNCYNCHNKKKKSWSR
ncbi:MAG: hypothetical protein A2X94_12990 [Bdellovibrionales bacterium GWB1_55_8]|nr:MAG: hypothetical protein A2X94_12990 [Bdellovibrionales bacterium GWB1_55_8]